MKLGLTKKITVPESKSNERSSVYEILRKHKSVEKFERTLNMKRQAARED